VGTESHHRGFDTFRSSAEFRQGWSRAGIWQWGGRSVLMGGWLLAPAWQARAPELAELTLTQAVAPKRRRLTRPGRESSCDVGERSIRRRGLGTWARQRTGRRQE
jgi:hypothetical protein